MCVFEGLFRLVRCVGGRLFLGVFEEVFSLVLCVWEIGCFCGVKGRLG